MMNYVEIRRRHFTAARSAVELAREAAEETRRSVEASLGPRGSYDWADYARAADDAHTRFSTWRTDEPASFPNGFDVSLIGERVVRLDHVGTTVEPGRWGPLVDLEDLASHVSFEHSSYADVELRGAGRLAAACAVARRDFDRRGNRNRYPVLFGWGVVGGSPAERERLARQMLDACGAWEIFDFKPVPPDPLAYRRALDPIVEGVQVTGLAFEPNEDAFPVCGQVAAFKSWFEVRPWLEAALELFPEPAAQVGVNVSFHPDRWGAVREGVRNYSRTWTFTIDGTFREGFSPLHRPEPLPDGPPLRYPLFQAADENAGKLLVQCDIVHAHDRSFLEFQSSEGRELLTDLLERLGGGYEFWEGPFEQRWGGEEGHG